MKNILITSDILLKNGFETNIFVSSDEFTYKSYTLWTKDKEPLKIDMVYKHTNNGANWYMHIDNCDCETIGSADIDYIEQFNKMMEIFESNYELKP